MLNAGATQNQPKGKSLPSLLQGEIVTVEEHIFAAKNVNPTAELVNRAISHDAKQIVRA